MSVCGRSAALRSKSVLRPVSVRQAPRCQHAPSCFEKEPNQTSTKWKLIWIEKLQSLNNLLSPLTFICHCFLSPLILHPGTTEPVRAIFRVKAHKVQMVVSPSVSVPAMNKWFAQGVTPWHLLNINLHKFFQGSKFVRLLPYWSLNQWQVDLQFKLRPASKICLKKWWVADGRTNRA